MKIAILGSGGREHALVNQMSLSKKTTKIYCIPGNAGTRHLAENVNLNLDNFESIYSFIFTYFNRFGNVHFKMKFASSFNVYWN